MEIDEKKCPACAEVVKADAKICKHCGFNFTTSQPGSISAKPIAAKSSLGIGKKGCLIAVGVLLGLGVLGAIVGGDDGDLTAGGSGASVDTSKVPAAHPDDNGPQNGLTGTQKNAARSARQYLGMSGFSRDGLIGQLSSDAGDGYTRSDATAAVDSLTVDWNEQAVRSAKQYLEMSGFSCKGLIQQLASSAGDRYTKSQATYGATQAGAC
jgi:Host cell surface-exposed lipoprotein./Uncharacterised protein family UPF0547.